jgi:hypothetical protein
MGNLLLLATDPFRAKYHPPRGFSRQSAGFERWSDVSGDLRLSGFAVGVN